MGFYLLFICGILGGILGGMGMGGGTVLIPLLTVLCGVEQGAAQGINLLSFLPMSALALYVHAQNGLLKTDGLWLLILPALFSAVGGALIAAYLPSVILKRAFGIFLVVLAVVQFSQIAKKWKKPEKKVAIH